MSDFSTDLTPAEQPALSTQLDEGRPTSEATPAKEPDKGKSESRLDAIKRAAADVEKANPEPAKDAEKEPKADEPKADAEPKKDEAEQATQEAATEKKAEAPKTEQPARRQPIEAPAKFLPRAKELWNNTPHEVRADMQRVIAEAEQEASQARESVKEYEAIKPYAEMARQNGTTIDQALNRYVNMEQALRQNPAHGFRELLGNMQMQPTQAIGHILRAFGVQPEQLAQHIMQAPNEYTALAQPQQQQAPQSNAEIEMLKQQIAEMQAGQQRQHVEANIIGPFAAENPRFHELQDTIAAFLKSDMIPKSLSPHDRLAAAYDMAVRISPSVKATPASDHQEAQEEQSESRAGKDFGGTKSVRGAPATGVDTSSHRRGKLSRGDAIKAAMSELGLAH